MKQNKTYWLGRLQGTGISYQQAFEMSFSGDFLFFNTSSENVHSVSFLILLNQEVHILTINKAPLRKVYRDDV